MRVEPHLAYLLHRRKYRETSLIIDILSSQHGRQSGVVRGAVGGRKRNRPLPDMFQPYEIAWTGRGELATITSLESCGPSRRLRHRALYCGFYVNELIVRLVGRDDHNPELFLLYQRTIEQLAGPDEPDTVLRRFEVGLLDACGYGLMLDSDAVSGAAIEPAREYFYQVEVGALDSPPGGDVVAVKGETLLALAGGGMLSAERSREAKRLMRYIIDFYLGDRPLVARALFRSGD